VDPISHLVLGPTLIAALPGGDSSRRARTMAAMVGAIAPDVDALLMPAGWDIYLQAHEVGTHTLAGSLPLALLTAALIGRFVRGARFGPLAAAAWIGCVSHIALDLLSGARIQVGWPLVAGRVSAPLVAMAEPWVVAIFVLSAVLSFSMPARRSLVARSTLAALAILFAAKGVLLARALAGFEKREDAAVARIVEARWASAAEWYVLDRRDGELRRWSIAPARQPALLFSWPLSDDTPFVSRSRALSTVRNFLAVHELSFAGQAPDSERASGQGLRVLWSDIRFCRAPRRGDDFILQAPRSPRAPSPSAIACELWFGGLFDRAGQPLQELVKVGCWWQARAPAAPR
jgi:membrane-bound metal-dependent hydrolase YbcI (DUF457 family)